MKKQIFKLIRILGFRLIRLTGLPFIFREILHKNKVTIILFHDISKETAEKTFNYLNRNYNIISLESFIDAIKNKNGNSIPKKALIITFDDGHIRNYDMLPIIKKMNIPITIFLCSAIINTNRHFWFKLKNLPMTLSYLKQKSNKEKLEILQNLGFSQDKENETPQAMRKSQIVEMIDYINMQSHTMYHPCLPKCSYEEAKFEISSSKEHLEKEYNINIDTISYPNGDYSERDIKLAKEAGYECGITVDYGFNNIDSDVFRLKRLCVNDAHDLNELIVKATGVWAFFKKRSGSKNGLHKMTNLVSK